MNPNMQNLKNYLKKHPINYETANVDSLLEDLYFYFVENNPPVGPELRNMYDQAHSCFAHLTTKEEDTLFRLFGDICTKQEQFAFNGGMRMGMELVLELIQQ